jgi:hypothetical protein
MYVCHICGKDNTMKDGGWLDNYGKKPNPNEVDVSVGPGFVGMGNDTTGRNYSPAWGGQFQSGGRLPIITNNPKDPRLKAYNDSLKLSQMFPRWDDWADLNNNLVKLNGKAPTIVNTKEGLRGVKKPVQPVVYKKSEREPIIVNDPKDPKLKAYQDSLSLYSKSKKAIGRNAVSKKNTPVYIKKGIDKKELSKDAYDFLRNQPIDISGRFDINMNPNENFPAPKVKQKIMPIGGIGINEGNSMGGWYNIYKKPVQPVEYKKLEEIKPTQPTPKGSKKYIVNDVEVSEEDFLGSGATTGGGKRVIYNTPNKGTQKVLRLDGTPETDPDKIRRALATANKDNMAMGGSLPGAVGFTYARVAGSAPSNGKYAKKTKASAQNGKEMKFYQEGLDFKPNSIAQDGGAIVDPMGQWAHPGEVTIIPATDITMEGVDYPVLGISDTGDTQMMYPGEDYDFDGEYVTEYPIMKSGGWLSKYQSGGPLSRSNLEMMSTLTKDIKNQKARNSQETISQYTPKPGDQERMNANKDAYRAEEAKPLNRLASNPHVVAASNNLPGAAEFALDVMTLGEGAVALNTIAKPIIKSIGKQVATKIEKRAAAKIAKKVISPEEQAAMDEWYRVGMLPKTTNQESIDVLNAFKERIKTPEGKKRLKELGISSDKALQKLGVFDEPNTYGVYYGGFNKIGVHPKLDATASRNIVRHEIEHGVQSAYVDSELQRLALKELPWNAKKIQAARENLSNDQTTNIDKMLGGLELKKKPTPNKVFDSSISSEPIDDPSDLSERLLDKQRATDYFTSGSEGKEKAPFVAELQQYMLDKGYINHPYEHISPEKVKEVMGEAYFDKVYPLRIFQIMKNTDNNHKIVANALNKLLAAPPIVAGGAAALSNAEEKENGGWLTKYK